MKIKCDSPEELMRKACATVTVQEFRALVLAFLTGVCLYVPMIVMRLNTGDGNTCGILYRSHQDYDWEDYCGRYLLKYFAHLKSLYVFDWLAVITSILFLVCSAMLICRMFHIRSTLGIWIATVFILFCPTFTETFGFLYLADSFILGFLLNTSAVYLLHEKQNVWRTGAAAVLMFISLALYQAYLFVAVTLFLFVLVRDLLEQHKTGKQIFNGLLWQLASGGLAVILYFAVDRILRAVGLIYYSSGRFNYAEAVSLSELPGKLLATYQDFYCYYFTQGILNNAWKGRWLLNGCVLLVGFLLLVTLILHQKRHWGNIVAIIVSVVLIPVGLMGIGVLYRAYIMTLPTACLLYVGVWALWAEVRDCHAEHLLQKLCGYILYGASACLLFIMGVYIAIYQIAMRYYEDRTKSIAQRIVTRVEELYPDTAAEDYLLIIGDVDEGNYPEDYRITQASFILTGTSACEGNLYNNMQGYAVSWLNYINYNLGVGYKQLTTDEAWEIVNSEFFEDMAVWPEEGCIDRTENCVIVVKLKEMN